MEFLQTSKDEKSKSVSKGNTFVRVGLVIIVLPGSLSLAAELFESFSYLWGFAVIAVAIYLLFGLLWPRRFSEGLARSPTSTSAERKPKRIVLFSDGTGNSSAKLFKTNVWRMYQAIDFGFPKSASREGAEDDLAEALPLQIGFYDNGVGTSGIAPLAILGGVFGLGLKRNVLEIYRFLCRNYETGDEIYCFGFSRGAYTIRMLAGLVASEGLVKDYRDERHLRILASQAFRAFIEKVHNPKTRSADKDADNKTAVSEKQDNRGILKSILALWSGSPFHISTYVRLLRRLLIGFHHALYGLPDGSISIAKHTRQHLNQIDEIRFIGVWDTVGAYGGPIIEFTQAIDKWVVPLGTNDYTLSNKVRKARHALALDDARASFRPILWDEMRSEAADLKQVWFAGMHSDVGGGYPDDGLSHVSLMWMIDELGDDLRFRPHQLEHYRSASNVFGPIHNSRKGLASYYRYQPRKISVFMSHGGDQEAICSTLSLRDPEVTDGPRGTKTGLLKECLVHSSVLQRIASGTDEYAPVSLPDHIKFEIDDLVAQQDDKWHDLRTNLEKCQKVQSRPDNRHTAVWRTVVRRRTVYFVMLWTTIYLIAALLEPSLIIAEDAVSADFSGVENFLPVYLKNMVVQFGQHPIIYGMITATILILFLFGRKMESNVQESSRLAWLGSILGKPALIAKLPWYENPKIQSLLQVLKWQLGPGLLAAIFYAVGIAFIYWAFWE